MPSASGQFEVAGWNEEPYVEIDGGGKLTRASVEQNVTGDVTGTAKAEWLMCYQADGTVRYVGLQRIEGTLDGREGTFVLETSGDFDGGAADGVIHVIPGSGTGALAGLRGDGKFHAPKGPTATFTLDYTV
jgi:hypothetical protein